MLVTGANGQLGQALRAASVHTAGLHFVFAASSDLDICDPDSVRRNFELHKPDFCINAAAYTAVDKAESDREAAFRINAEAVNYLASSCDESNCTLIQISTDFVFDGKKRAPYLETDTASPLNVYGASKLAGESAAARCPKHFIVRTSWVYSHFGHNFFKTMLRLASERDRLTVVNDQMGTPTYAPDLASALIRIVLSNSCQYGIYHYSNLGEATWFDFATEIFRKNDVRIDLQPVPTAAFPTAAERPPYSVMDKSKIMRTFNLSIRPWEDAVPSIRG